MASQVVHKEIEENLERQIKANKELFDEMVFKLDERVMIVENFRADIDANKKSIEDNIVHVTDMVTDIREQLETEKLKSIVEF